MVQMPDCRTLDGGQREGAVRIFNEAYRIGGSACVQRTVEQLTGIRIDHHVVVDFTGFRKMVDALGGVDVCIPNDVNDTTGNITLEAGRRTFKGDEALDYVRVRHGIDGTGDIGRMKRQQAFLASMIKKATDTGTLTNPPKLYAFLNAATKSVTTDPALANINALRKLAQQVQGIGLDKIRFLTVPNQPYRPDPDRLAWDPEKAPRLWRLIREDRPLPANGRFPAKTVPVAPSDIRVELVDGTGRPAVARIAASDLTSLGFEVVDVRRGEREDQTTTVVRHDPRYDRSAATVATALRGARLEVERGQGRTMSIVLGRDYTGVDELVVRRPGASKTPGAEAPKPAVTAADPSLESRRADADVCS
jgi:LCP family protein required for cell wall assembly